MRPVEADDGRRQALRLATAENNAVAEVMFDQREIGNPNYDCHLPPIDVVASAKTFGADGLHGDRPTEIRPVLQAVCSSPSPALVEAVLDPEEKPTKRDELRA